MSKVNVLLIEDHPLMRTGIRSLVVEQSSFMVKAEAGTLAEARLCLKKERFDLILLDLTLPDGFGLNLLTEIQSSQNKTPTIILTMHNEEPYLAKAIKLGAAGYVVKDMAPERLVETMFRVIRGEKCFFMTSQDDIPVATSIEKMACHLGSFGREANKDFIRELDKHESKQASKALSPREQKVMDMIVLGKSLTEIGDELSLSVKTIFTYRVRIFKKLGIASNADLIRLGYARQLDSN